MSEQRPNALDDIFVMGIGKETYEELLEIAKKKGISVTDEVSRAIKKHVESQKNIGETTEKRVLLEG